MCDASCSATKNGPVPTLVPEAVLEMTARLSTVSGRTAQDSMTTEPSFSYALRLKDLRDSTTSPGATGEPSLNLASARIEARIDLLSMRSSRDARASFVEPSGGGRP